MPVLARCRYHTPPSDTTRSFAQDRLRYEAESLREMHRHCPAHVPQLFDYDAAMFTLTMQFLAPPHVVLRYGLLDGATYPHVASQAAEQLACCLFRTSAFALEGPAFRTLADRFSNPAMCQLTEQVRFAPSFAPCQNCSGYRCWKPLVTLDRLWST